MITLIQNLSNYLCETDFGLLSPISYDPAPLDTGLFETAIRQDLRRDLAW